MEFDQLLRKLAKDEVFMNDLKEVPLTKCAVFLLKNELAADKEPDAADEVGDSVLELRVGKTVGSVAEQGKCKGDRLFIHVRLPGMPEKGAGA